MEGCDSTPSDFCCPLANKCTLPFITMSKIELSVNHAANVACEREEKSSVSLKNPVPLLPLPPLLPLLPSRFPLPCPTILLSATGFFGRGRLEKSEQNTNKSTCVLNTTTLLVKRWQIRNNHNTHRRSVLARHRRRRRRRRCCPGAGCLCVPPVESIQ
jgi:hypothetical protein